MSYKVIDSRASRRPVPLGVVQEALATSQEAREMCAKAFGVPVEMLESYNVRESRIEQRRHLWKEINRGALENQDLMAIDAKLAE